MDLDRPHHHTPTTTSELFICFTSRLSSSSSSMKLSKSILSPSHARDPPLSLPTSLSRRLRTNGSIKGGQSPMFPPTGKKRGSGFENPEPSSPKVTCIGQVKMKTKKKVKQTRSLSKRRSDLSFRKLEQTPHHEMLNQIQRNSSVHFQPQDCVSHRNQRWVHLPLTIYEALREFSCLFPCRSSCFSTNEKEKEEKCNGSREGNNSQRSCGDVFARWLVALQEGEAEKSRGVELVVANNSMEEEKKTMEEMQMSMRSSRRHVFEDIEFKDESIEEEKARVSISVPPKNALLLMRCRSDPMKMVDLTNRFWESPAHKQNDEDEEEEEDGNTEANEPVEEPVDEEMVSGSELAQETEQEDEEEESEIKPLVAEVNAIEQVEKIQDNQEEEAEEEQDSSSSNGSYSSSFSENSDGEEFSETEEEKFKSAIKKEIEEILLLQNITENAKSNEAISEPVKIEVKKEDHEIQFEYTKKAARCTDLTLCVGSGEEADQHKDHEVQFEYTKKAAQCTKPALYEGFGEKPDHKEPIKQHKESVLPDCLLLMMCEPKLSMEVSKETWVCSNDFILPQRKQAHHQAEKKQESMKRSSIDSKPPTHILQDSKNQQRLLQPPRSSCSFPAAGGVSVKSMATLIEQKLVNAVAYEPFVLTRCKSEPMRSAAAKLAPGIGF